MFCKLRSSAYNSVIYGVILASCWNLLLENVENGKSILLAYKGSFGKTQDKLSTLAYHQKDILHSRIFQMHAVHTRSLSDANKA